MNPGFTPGMEEERDRRRKILLSSVLMESKFSPADVARVLSQHKNGRIVSRDAAKSFLIAMEEDGLIARVTGKVAWCKKRSPLAGGPWVKRDNGIRLGSYLPGMGA